MTQLDTSTDASTPTKKITASYNAGKTDPLILISWGNLVVAMIWLRNISLEECQELVGTPSIL